MVGLLGKGLPAGDDRAGIGQLMRGAPEPPEGHPIDDGLQELIDSWDRLQQRARYRARTRFDADDLFAAAVANVWEKWVAGTGPTTNVVGYVTRAMQNRLIDEFRAPASNDTSLDVVMTHASYVDDVSHIDNHIEHRWLAHAIERMPEDLQRVLRDSVVDGLTPRELEPLYGIPAPAISTAVYRAKKKLRSELFLVIMGSSCHNPACDDARSRIVRELWRSPRLDPVDAHASVGDCAHCRTGLDRYFTVAHRAIAA